MGSMNELAARLAEPDDRPKVLFLPFSPLFSPLSNRSQVGSMDKLAALLGERPAQITAPQNVQRNTALVRQMLMAAGIDPSIVERGVGK